MSFFEPYKDGYLLRIKLSPNASRSAFGAEVFTDSAGKEYLKASVTVVPEKGKANRELLKMLASELKLSGSNLEVIGGQTDHLKKIYIKTPLSEDFEQKLLLLRKEKR